MMDACKKEEERLMVAMLRRDPELKQRYNFNIYRKVYMPVKDFLEYNFIGLVLGPRGATQRQMEDFSSQDSSRRRFNTFLLQTHFKETT